MKIIIKKEYLIENPAQVLKQAGYHFHIDRKMGKESFSRRMGSGHYPRLHMYVKEEGDRVIFDLHLDQKQASYAGAHMHNAEYDGPIVEQEIARLKQYMSSLFKQHQGTLRTDERKNIDNSEEPANKIGHANLDDISQDDLKRKKKKGWLSRFFS